MTGDGPRRDAGFGDLEALVWLVQPVQFLLRQQRAPVDVNRVEVQAILFDGPVGDRQVMVAGDEGRGLVSLGQVKRRPSRMERFLDRTGRQQEAGKFVLRGVQHEQEVALGGASGQAGRRAGPLGVVDDDGRLADAGQS